MANLYAIAAVSETLKGILHDGRLKPELENAVIDIYQPSDYQKPNPITEGISILLYRVGVSAGQRGIAVRLDGTRRAPALPVDLHYLLTVWGKPTTQHYLLGWMMRLLEDSSHIEAAVLNHYGSKKPFQEDESVSIVQEPLALADLSSLWEMLKPSAQLSVGYVVRMVYLESLNVDKDHDPVQTRVFNMAQVTR